MTTTTTRGGGRDGAEGVHISVDGLDVVLAPRGDRRVRRRPGRSRDDDPDPPPLPQTTTTTTCGRRDSGCWLELRVAYARYYDAMTIADDVVDDAKHRRREDESSSSAENVRTMMAPREASGERIVASKALDWGG